MSTLENKLNDLKQKTKDSFRLRLKSFDQTTILSNQSDSENIEIKKSASNFVSPLNSSIRVPLIFEVKSEKKTQKFLRLHSVK